MVIYIIALGAVGFGATESAIETDVSGQIKGNIHIVLAGAVRTLGDPDLITKACYRQCFLQIIEGVIPTGAVIFTTDDSGIDIKNITPLAYGRKLGVGGKGDVAFDLHPVADLA